MNHHDVLKLLYPADLGGVFDDDITIEGSYLDALTSSADALQNELFPDTCTAATIADWERVYGCGYNNGDSLATRQARVLTKIRRNMGITRSAIISIALGLGYTITITENNCAAQSVCGVTRCGFRLCPSGYLFQWTVNAALPAKPDLESLVNDLAPAHTQVLFHYS